MDQIAQLYQEQGQNSQEIFANFKLNQKIELTQLYTYITKEEQLDQLNVEGHVLGIDIEHTDDMGFDGRISLIQIKDANQVYLIDTIEIDLDSKKLINKLQSIFENPNLVKVFYAAGSDVQWLKRDYQIKVCNLCDIKEIADRLALKGGLVQLWSKYCNYHISKHYKTTMQTSDWCERPLTQEQLAYAAFDCYYLPYLRYVLLSELTTKLEAEQLRIMATMNKLCSKEYKKPIKTKQQFILLAKSTLNTILQETQELPEIPKLYLELITKINANKLVKYISAELFTIRQQFALKHNDPPESLEEDSQIVLIAIKIFEKLNINNIQIYEQFYQDMKQYQNKQYDLTLQYLQNQYDKEWEDFLKLFIKGLYQSYIHDPNFIKYSLTQVYDAENQVQQIQNESQKQSQNKLDEKKQKQAEFNEKYTRQKPAYGNCKIYTKEDLLLCNCDEKKIRWYLKQGLADQISDDPPTIKLKFDPSGFKQENSDKVEYITIERVNQCVVCGCDQHLLKYHIVPVMYKKHIQGKRSYDVVCLCNTCHQKASTLNDQFKLKVAEKYHIPLQQNTKKDSIFDKSSNFIKSIENYQKREKNMPIEAQTKFLKQFQAQLKELIANPHFENMYAELIQKLEKDEENEYLINQNLFNQLIHFKETLNDLRKYNESPDHGQAVVEQLKTENDIDEFLIFWRNQFLDQLKPQYLTEAWAVDHKFKRTFGEKSIFNNKEQPKEQQENLLNNKEQLEELQEKQQQQQQQ